MFMLLFNIKPKKITTASTEILRYKGISVVDK